MTSMHLNAEILAMPVAQEKPPPPTLRSFMPLSATVPCDFHLLNLRMLQGEVSQAAHTNKFLGACGGDRCLQSVWPHFLGQNWVGGTCPVDHVSDFAHFSAASQDDSLPSTEMALLLHRKGFDCSLEARNLGFNCTTTQGTVGGVGWGHSGPSQLVSPNGRMLSTHGGCPCWHKGFLRLQNRTVWRSVAQEYSQ